jgi:hypothetical protein
LKRLFRRASQRWAALFPYRTTINSESEVSP